MSDNQPNTSKRIIGQSWLSVAKERIDAGESELMVMKDYGYIYSFPEDPHVLWEKIQKDYGFHGSEICKNLSATFLRWIEGKLPNIESVEEQCYKDKIQNLIDKERDHCQ